MVSLLYLFCGVVLHIWDLSMSQHVVMSQTSKKLRRQIGLGPSVRLLVARLHSVKKDRDRILKFGMRDEYETINIYIL